LALWELPSRTHAAIARSICGVSGSNRAAIANLPGARLRRSVNFVAVHPNRANFLFDFQGPNGR
jgi:hypothetical protein